MNAYLALTRTYLLLTLRDRLALFFSYIMPLVFFFIFSQLMHAERGTAVLVVNMVLTIGILGTGLFGAGMRATIDRETNILRRFKVAPISPAPILVASFVVGLLNFLPIYVLILVLSNWLYGMPLPPNLISLTVFVIVGVLAFRAIGLMIASVANSMQEAQILIQSLYMPMLFLSGATIPFSVMPEWVQIAAQFLPATHLFSGMQAILGAGQTVARNLTALGALALTTVLSGFLGVKLFRWEKEEKLPATAKLWVLGVLAPFVLMGVYQARSKENVAKNKVFDREISRRVTYLVKNARIFTGDGTTIEQGSVLVRDGRIAEVYTGLPAAIRNLDATEIDGAGKTLLPGLIDVNVDLSAPGGFYEKPQDYDRAGMFKHALAAYLYCGVTAVRTAGDPIEDVLKERGQIRSGEHLGAELFVSGPLFTAAGGRGTEILKGDWFDKLPESAQKAIASDILRTPHSPEEARAQVDAIRQRGVDAVKVMADHRLAPAVLNAIVAEAHRYRLPVSVNTGVAEDVRNAIAAGADSVEHGSDRQPLPADLFDAMKSHGMFYDPSLTAIEAITDFGTGNTEPLERSLVQQVVPRQLLAGTRHVLATSRRFSAGRNLETAMANLVVAWRHGVRLVTGTDSGVPLAFHGPGVHRELQLWVQAGIPPAVSLQAATDNAALLLHAGGRIGLIKKGYQATFILVDGDPLKDIGATERISAIFYKGEHIRRGDLFDDEKEK